MLHIAYWMTFQSITQYSDILQLSIADGLKELLIDHGFTRQKILRVPIITVGINFGNRRLRWQDYLQRCKT